MSNGGWREAGKKIVIEWLRRTGTYLIENDQDEIVDDLGKLIDEKVQLAIEKTNKRWREGIDELSKKIAMTGADQITYRMVLSDLSDLLEDKK